MNVRLLHWKRAARAVLLILLLNVAGMMNVFAQEQFEADNLLYTIISTTPPQVSLDGHVDGTDFEEELYIPESVYFEDVSYTVTAISANAFADYSLMYGDLEIPSTVTTIGDYAFYNCNSLDGTLTIGESVTSIGSYAFANFFGMTSQLSIPNSVTQMGDHAFALGNFMGSLTISSSLTAIPDYAFQGCAYFSGDLLIPSSVTSIGSHAFDGCTSLNGKLQFPNPNTVTSIGDYAFYQCSNLTNMGTFSTNGITQIGDYAFYGCSHLTGQLSIYNTVTHIGDYAFYYCSGFTSINFNNTNPQLTSIGDYAFAYCSGFIANLALPKSLQTIGDYAFYYCTGLNGNLTFRTGIPLNSIGAYAFSECSFKNTQGLVIPNTVTSMGQGAFAYCDDFTSTLTLGSNLTAIPYNAFNGCSFTGQLTIPASVTAIGESAFSGCSGFSGALVIPENVTSIGSAAFSNCTGFTQLDYNAINCTIDNDSWREWLYECNSITTLNIGENVEVIPNHAFMNQEQFTGNLTIPGSVTEIGNYAFAHCGFTGVTFNEGLTRISGYAFENCTGITSIELPESLTFLSGFYGCTGLTSVTIPAAVEGIGNTAFRDCTNLLEINFNATNCTTVNAQSGDESWLENCQSLTTINIGENVHTIPNYAFYDCSTLTGDLVIPNSVTTIGERAFYQTSFNGSLTIGESVTNIGDYAFYNDAILFVSITSLSETPTSLGDNVFFASWYGSPNIPVYVPCGSEGDYASIAWGGFSNFNGLCSGTVTVAADPAEGGAVTGGGTFEGGQSCTVTATANSSYVFANWTANGVLVSTLAEYTFPVVGDMALVAHFVPEGNIVFADANVKAICVEHWDTNGDGELSYAEAASVTDLSNFFQNNSSITSFDELQYFIGLSSIGEYAFYYCTGLTSITLPNSLTSIGNYAFNNCHELTGDLVIPNSVTTIGERAFYECTGFNGSITIGENVTNIGHYAFASCSNLTTLNYNAINSNASNAYMDYGWLEYCPNLHTLNIGENVQMIPDNAFYGGWSDLSFTGDLVIPNSVTTIGENAFRGNGFTSITIGGNVESIGNQAFYDCSSINLLYCLVETLPALGENVFQYVNQTIPVYVPCNAVETYQNASWGGFSNFNGICGGVIVVEAEPAAGGTTTGAGTYEAGQYCTVTATANAGFAFANWTVNGVIVSTNSEYTFPIYSDMTIVAHFVTDGNIVFADANVKSICVANWDANSDGELSYAEAASVTDLSNYFQYNSSITSFDELQYFIGLSTIGDNAFYNCYGLTSIVLPNALTSIGNYALYGCYGLTSVVLPSSLTSIGNYAFYSCSGLTSIVLPSSLTTIGDYAFYYCSNIQSITSLALVPPTIMGYYTLNYCYNKPLYIPCGTLEAYQNATYWSYFTNIQTELNDYFVQDGLRYEIISSNPPQVMLTGFADGFYSAENLVVPASIYSECSELNYAVTQIADSAFIENEYLVGTLTLPESLTRIGNSAFDACTGLNGTLVIPENVTWIGRWAFYSCNFNAIHYNATNCESIGYTEDNEFGACFLWNTMLEEIVIGDNVTQIPANAFAATYADNCQLTLGNSVQTIGNEAFRNAGLAGDLVIPASVTQIGNMSFAYNGNLIGDLELPASLLTIGNSAFIDCTGLTGTLTIPENVTRIGMRGFVNCGFSEVHFNAINCESMGWDENHQYIYYVFWQNSNLQEIVIGENVTQIPDYAFGARNSQNCHLTFLGNAVTSIGSYAFYHDENDDHGLVGALVIPASVTSIYSYAFSGCSGITEIWSQNTSAPWTQSSAFNGVDKSIPVHVPCGSLSNYQNASTWSTFTNYSENPYVLVVRSNDEMLGTASVTLHGSCADNGSIVHAEANLGGVFINWTTPDGTFVSNNADYSFALTNDITLVANFMQLEGHHNFVGSGDWNDVDNWSPKELPTETSTVGIFGYAELYDNATVASATVYNDYYIYIGSDAALTVTGTLTTSDDSRVYLDEGGQLYHANDGVNAELWRTITPYTTGEADGWHLIASPLEEEVDVNEVENLTANEYDLYYYDEPTHYWMNQEYAGNGFNALENAKGYLYGNNGIASYDTEIQLGEYQATTSTNPMCSGYKYSISEQLFLASELTAAGVDTNPIKSISWYSNSNFKLNGISIWMANVDDAALTSTSHNTSDMQLVFTGGCTTTYNGWTEFEFNRGHFIWDGTSNVIVCVQNNGTPTSYSINWSRTNSLGFVASSYRYNGSTPYDMSSNTYSTYTYSYRPITRFKMENTSLPFEAQVGEGENALSLLPINSLWNYSISEQLFRADELTEAGVGRVINSLSWYATAVGEVPTQRNISIWMANVSDTYLTTTSHNTSNMTLVYYGSFTPQVGWNEFAFNWNDFEWDGTSNVLVCVQRNNGDWKSGLNWQTHTTNFNASCYKTNDDNAYYMSSNTYPTTVTTERANTLFKCVARDTTIAFTGEVKNGVASVNVPLSYTETAGNLKGFNLVGNPFAHNVTSYGSVNVANGCYIMNGAKNDLIVSEISEENPLKPLEGFFVKATSADASITFNPQRGASMAKSNSIRIEVSKDNKLLDRLIVKDSEGQSLEKLNLNEKRTQVFAIQDQKEVSIVPCEGNEQPFSFKASKDGNYTINVDADDMEFTYLHLIDNLTGNDVNLLAEPSYTFEAKTTDYASRFKLVFATGSSEDPESDSFAFFNNSGNLTIFGIEGTATLQVVDVLGHVLNSEQFSGSYEKKLDVAPGVYMLRLINGDDVKVQKIVVR